MFSFQIRILVIVLFFGNVRCQDVISNRDLLRLHQIANEGQIEPNTSYNTNVLQLDPHSQTFDSMNVQYQMTDDARKQEDYTRSDRGRNKKVYRIKNPFQRNVEDETRQQETNSGSQDSDSGASNQYAAMQYSLPPEEFLQQMRAENHYYQQQTASVEQASTPSPNLGYTATPQPQYQYSTIAASGYDNNSQQSNQISQLEPKVPQSQSYRSIANPYQYNGPNSYGFENAASTPSPLPPYLSTSSNSQYIGTPANTYVSSSSPIFLSSPSNIKQYVSSPQAPVPAGVVEYKVTSTIGSNILNYDSPEKKMQIDISANGLRYHPHYQSDYPSSTPSPSTPYPDPVRDSWQNTMNSNALQKSLQDAAISQYQKYTYGKNQQESRPDLNSESDTHRIGNSPSANNVYLSFMQPDYQALQNLRSHTRDLEQETSQTEHYSHGEYGWKLNDKKPQGSQIAYSPVSNNFPFQHRYQSPGTPPEGVAVSQMSFHMDTGRSPNFEQISKSGPDHADAQEFAKAAAKAHENMKRHQYYGSDYPNYNTQALAAGSIYGNEKQRNKIYTENGNTYIYSSAQPDLITASPYNYFSNRENTVDDKPKQPFDHDKALKNIVPIDVSNVVNSESQQKLPHGLDNSNRYSPQPYGKDQLEQNLKQNFKTITDSFYQDKNTIYGLNIRPKPEEISASDVLKYEPNLQYYSKPPEQYYSQNSPAPTYIPSQTTSYQDSLHSSANIQPQGVQRPQNPTDISSILKLSDIPYRITQNLPPESFRMNNDYQPIELPTPLPVRLNQNVGTHQLDVATKILNNLVLNKQQLQLNRPEIESQSNGLSTINGFKVANPYNVDLNLVANILKGKPTFDDSRMINMREQYVKPTPPLRLDLAQLQQLLFKQEVNNPNISPISEGLTAYTSPYFDLYSSGRYPYTGVKYSRSQEEEESIVPIADASNNHPIGAVVEQDDVVDGREIGTELELTGHGDDHLAVTNSLDEERHKTPFAHKPRPVERHKHNPHSTITSRFPYPRKYAIGGIAEPYPLLKPPPRLRSMYNKNDKRKRRLTKRPRLVRIMKTEPLFESDSEDHEVPTLLRPPPPEAEAKSDKVVDKQETSSS